MRNGASLSRFTKIVPHIPSLISSILVQELALPWLFLNTGLPFHHIWVLENSPRRDECSLAAGPEADTVRWILQKSSFLMKYITNIPAIPAIIQKEDVSGPIFLMAYLSACLEIEAHVWVKTILTQTPSFILASASRACEVYSCQWNLFAVWIELQKPQRENLLPSWRFGPLQRLYANVVMGC